MIYAVRVLLLHRDNRNGQMMFGFGSKVEKAYFIWFAIVFCGRPDKKFYKLYRIDVHWL